MKVLYSRLTMLHACDRDLDRAAAGDFVPLLPCVENRANAGFATVGQIEEFDSRYMLTAPYLDPIELAAVMCDTVQNPMVD